jgi:hypothetical protein
MRDDDANALAEQAVRYFEEIGKMLPDPNAMKTGMEQYGFLLGLMAITEYYRAAAIGAGAPEAMIGTLFVDTAKAIGLEGYRLAQVKMLEKML